MHPHSQELRFLGFAISFVFYQTASEGLVLFPVTSEAKILLTLVNVDDLSHTSLNMIMRMKEYKTDGINIFLYKCYTL